MAQSPDNPESTPDLPLQRLAYEVTELDRLYRVLDRSRLHQAVYPDWSALDVLAHLVWWHESFAAIVVATSRNEDPPVPRGTLAQVNERSVQELGALSPLHLRTRLRAAQHELEGHAGMDRATPLPYRRGSRHYTFAERIGIAAGEMHQHRWDVLQVLLGP